LEFLTLTSLQARMGLAPATNSYFEPACKASVILFMSV
jgi:hypothetical protein